MKIMISPSVSKVNGPIFLISQPIATAHVSEAAPAPRTVQGFLPCLEFPCFRSDIWRLQLSRFFNEHGRVLHQLDCGLAQRFGFPGNLFGSWFFWPATIMPRRHGRRNGLWTAKPSMVS